MLASASVQEAHDFALIGQAATLRARVPFLHFFDGFRTSHEVAKIQALDDDVLQAMLPDDADRARTARRALTPDHPVIRGTAQNPDTFFQAREACNALLRALPRHRAGGDGRVRVRTGRALPAVRLRRRIRPRSASSSSWDRRRRRRTRRSDWLRARGERVGVLKVRLYRPFSAAHLLAALPASTRAIAVLDRTKEPGALGEPLYQDVVTALRGGRARPIAPVRWSSAAATACRPRSSTPAMVTACSTSCPGRRRATTSPSASWTTSRTPRWRADRDLDIEPDDRVAQRLLRAGRGRHGRRQQELDQDHRRRDAGLRAGLLRLRLEEVGRDHGLAPAFRPAPIRSAYLVRQAGFVGCHQFGFLDRYDVLDAAAPGAVLLLNAPYGPTRSGTGCRATCRQQHRRQAAAPLRDRRATTWPADSGHGQRINTIMQTCFFALSGVLPRDEAIAPSRTRSRRPTRKRGAEIVRKNFEAVDATLAHLHECRCRRGRPATARAAAGVPATRPTSCSG